MRPVKQVNPRLVSRASRVGIMARIDGVGAGDRAGLAGHVEDVCRIMNDHVRPIFANSSRPVNHWQSSQDTTTRRGILHRGCEEYLGRQV